MDKIKEYRKKRRKMIIPKIIGRFKMECSKEMNLLRYTANKKNWQANYHDRVIRNDKSYWRIRNYIIENPAKWEEDKFYMP